MLGAPEDPKVKRLSLSSQLALVAEVFAEAVRHPGLVLVLRRRGTHAECVRMAPANPRGRKIRLNGSCTTDGISNAAYINHVRV